MDKIAPPNHFHRYHPHGMTESSTCKYLDNLKLSSNFNSLSSSYDTTKENYYPSLVEGLSAVECADWLKSNMRVSCFYCQNADDFKYLGIYDSFGKDKFLDRGVPVDKDMYDRDVRAMCAVCKDFKKRIPNLSLDLDWFIPWNMHRAPGVSTIDRRDGVSYLSIGDVDWHSYKGEAFHHKDSRMIYDVLRHEIGHSLETDEVLEICSDIRDMLFGGEESEQQRQKQTQIINELYRKVSNFSTYSYRAQFNKIPISSEEDERFRGEMFAELFSYCTQPNYEQNKLAFELEKIPAAMLEIASKKNRRNVTMDGRNNSGDVSEFIECNELPPFPFTSADAAWDSVRGVWVPWVQYKAEANSRKEDWTLKMPEGRPRSLYATWDYKNGDWVEFQNREEKCRYLEKFYGHDDSYIEWLLKSPDLDSQYPIIDKAW